MPDPRGFLHYPRQTAPSRPPAERVRDHREIHLEMAPAEVSLQARRCMRCSIPFCHHGCPLHNLIPDWNRLVDAGSWRAALERLSRTNNFPEFTGRLCPAPCEPACVLSLNDQPVAIKDIELAIVERGFTEGWVAPAPPAAASGSRVAVVGSGPAGLAAAQQLARAGHQVVVFEKADLPGGLLRYGIPDFKLPKAVLDRRLAQLRAEGVEFRCGVAVGVRPSFGELASSFDAVCLAVGARQPRELEVPGRELHGVHLAMDYLEGQNRQLAGRRSGAGSRPPSAQGRRVVVLGGGDTGADCLGNALREGCLGVEQLELLPAPPLERGPDNPWPEWPVVLRASPAHEEGGHRAFALRTLRFVGIDGRVTGLEVERVRWAGARSSSPGLEAVPGSRHTIPGDLILLALGFQGPRADDLPADLARDALGRVSATPDGSTGRPGLFACGDAVDGASLVVRAIASGRRCAAGVASWLASGALV